MDAPAPFYSILPRANRPVFGILIFAITASIVILGIPTMEKSQVLTTDDFGVGFDLTMTYATIAIAFPDKSPQAIARVDGDASYKEMMLRLSLPSSQTPHQPYDHMGDQYDDYFRHEWRAWRKHFGFPASQDVGILANMLSSLLLKAENFTTHPITKATISIPRLAALYGEDTIDAFEYLGLQNIPFYPFYDYYPLHASNTVYAGNNLGLCRDYRNSTSCDADERVGVMPLVWALAVAYTNTSLEVSLARCGAASYVVNMVRVLDLEVGFGALPSGEGSDEVDAFWEKVRSVLAYPIATSSIKRNVTIVILWGEAAKDERFKEVLKGVVDEQVEFEDPKWVEGDVVFSAAIGAAEFAKRALYEQARGIESVMIQGDRRDEV